jgi:DNA polymerase-3 subunit epsilon
LPGPPPAPAPQSPLADQPLAGEHHQGQDLSQGKPSLQSLQAMAAASGAESNLGFTGESIYNSAGESITESIAESITESITEPITEPTAELITEPITELTAELAAEPITESIAISGTEIIASEPELTDSEPISPDPIGSTPIILDPAIPELAAPEVISSAPISSTLITLEPINSELIAEPAAAAPVCPVRLLIVDTETSGLDPATGKCLEVGVVLFDVPHRAVLSQLSFLLPASSNPAQHVNGIDPAVTRLEQPWRQSLQMLDAMVAGADAVLAHNAAFDRQWFGIEPLPALDRPWICSMDDIHWPVDRHLKPRPSLQALALAYGVPVWAAHRALTDCIYLVQVLERCADLEQLLVEAQEPRQLFRAQLSYAERFRAKQAGFRWNDPVAGAWSRRLSEREARSLPFPVQPVCA